MNELHGDRGTIEAGGVTFEVKHWTVTRQRRLRIFDLELRWFWICVLWRGRGSDHPALQFNWWRPSAAHARGPWWRGLHIWRWEDDPDAPVPAAGSPQPLPGVRDGIGTVFHVEEPWHVNDADWLTRGNAAADRAMDAWRERVNKAMADSLDRQVAGELPAPPEPPAPGPPIPEGQPLAECPDIEPGVLRAGFCVVTVAGEPILEPGRLGAMFLRDPAGYPGLVPVLYLDGRRVHAPWSLYLASHEDGYPK
jgi:hypothetical protein